MIRLSGWLSSELDNIVLCNYLGSEMLGMNKQHSTNTSISGYICSSNKSPVNIFFYSVAGFFILLTVLFEERKIFNFDCLLTQFGIIIRLK